MNQVNFNSLTELHRDDYRIFLKIFRQTLDKSDFILGEHVLAFEKVFSKFVQSKFTLGVGNGSDAIRLALLASGVERKQKVAVAVNTYFAAAAAIAQLGATPVFVDVNPATRFPDYENVSDLESMGVKYFIRSHLFGFADTVKLSKKIKNIHDCSQAHGTYVNDKHVGFNELSTFSFYPGKNLGAFGDAGAITTCNKKEFIYLTKLRNQGTQKSKYLHEIIGFNSRLDTVQAGILTIKLGELEKNNLKRRNLAKEYDSYFNNMDERLNVFIPDSSLTPSYHLYQVKIAGLNFKKFEYFMNMNGIEIGRHYPIPLHLQPAFAFLGYKRGQFKYAEALAREVVSLPMHPNLKLKEIEYVASKIAEYLKVATK